MTDLAPPLSYKEIAEMKEPQRLSQWELVMHDIGDDRRTEWEKCFP